MIVQAKDMVRDVRVAIDMNRRDAALLAEGDCETLDLDEVIASKLLDAVALVEQEAPAMKLCAGHGFADNVYIGADGKGFVILPLDFMRLLSFRMSDWERTVYDAISPDDPQYALQSSRWKGVCGCPERPVCAVVMRAEGKVLEFYSCADDKATVAQASYMPYPHIDNNGGIDIAPDCYRAAVYRAASLALASVGDQLSTTMLEISKSLLQ